MTKIKLILGGLALLALLSGIYGIYHFGKTTERTSTENVQLKSYKKDVEKNEKIDKQVRGMDKSTIDNSLSHWLRND